MVTLPVIKFIYITCFKRWTKRTKGGFPLRHYFARNKIGPFSIVVFREKLKKVEIFSTFFAEN